MASFRRSCQQGVGKYCTAMEFTQSVGLVKLVKMSNFSIRASSCLIIIIIIYFIWYSGRGAPQHTKIQKKQCKIAK